MKKKQTKKTKQEDSVFVIEVQAWDFSYSLSVDHNKSIVEGQYWEHSALVGKSKLLHPSKFGNREIELDIMPSRLETQVLNNPNDYEKSEPLGVGSLSLRGNAASVPFDAFQALCAAISGHKVNYVIMYGPSLYHGSTYIKSIRL